MAGLPKTQHTAQSLMPAGLRQLVDAAIPPDDPQSVLPLPGGFGMAAAPKMAQGALRGLQGVASALKQPKVGGTLYEVLERAGLKSGLGQSLTPGENSLMEQFKTWGKR